MDVPDIVFPETEEDHEDDEEEDIIPPIRGVPSCARSGDTFCEDIHGYPHNRVETLLKLNNSFNSLFGVDVPPEQFVNRVGAEEDKFLCEANHRLIFPKVGKTKTNTWQYIINQENSREGFVQGVRIETCK